MASFFAPECEYMRVVYCALETDAKSHYFWGRVFMILAVSETKMVCELRYNRSSKFIYDKLIIFGPMNQKRVLHPFVFNDLIISRFWSRLYAVSFAFIVFKKRHVWWSVPSQVESIHWNWRLEKANFHSTPFKQISLKLLLSEYFFRLNLRFDACRTRWHTSLMLFPCRKRST